MTNDCHELNILSQCSINMDDPNYKLYLHEQKKKEEDFYRKVDQEEYFWNMDLNYVTSFELLSFYLYIFT